MINMKVHREGRDVWGKKIGQTLVLMFGPLARRVGAVPREKVKQKGAVKKEQHMAEAVEAYRWMSWNR